MPGLSTINQISAPAAKAARDYAHRLEVDGESHALRGLQMAVSRADPFYDRFEAIDHMPTNVSFADPETRGLLFYLIMTQPGFNWERFTHLGQKYADGKVIKPFLRPTKRYRLKKLRQAEVDYALAGFYPASGWTEVSARTKAFLSAQGHSKRARLRKAIGTASTRSLSAWRRKWDAKEIETALLKFETLADDLHHRHKQYSAGRTDDDTFSKYQTRYGASAALVAQFQQPHISEAEVVAAVVMTAKRKGVTSSFSANPNAIAHLLHLWTAFKDVRRAAPKGTSKNRLLSNPLLARNFWKRVGT